MIHHIVLLVARSHARARDRASSRAPQDGSGCVEEIYAQLYETGADPRLEPLWAGLSAVGITNTSQQLKYVQTQMVPTGLDDRWARHRLDLKKLVTIDMHANQWGFCFFGRDTDWPSGSCVETAEGGEYCSSSWVFAFLVGLPNNTLTFVSDNTGLCRPWSEFDPTWAAEDIMTCARPAVDAFMCGARPRVEGRTHRHRAALVGAR